MRERNISIPTDQLTGFCRRHHIRRLALFGSVLDRSFRDDSDVDVLVEFAPDHAVGLIRFAGLEIELSEILARTVDLNTVDGLSRHFRDEVVAEAEVLYVEP